MKKLILAVLLLSSSLVYAADPQVYPQQGVLSFKGLDNKSSPTAVKDGRASDLLNVKFDVTGALIKRPGFSVVGEDMDIQDVAYEAIQGIHYMKYSSGNEDTLVACGGRFYRYDTTLTPDNWTRINGAVGTTGDNYQYVWANALDTVIMTNDQDVVFKYTESGTIGLLDVSDLTDTLTKAKCLVWYKNYLIFGNTVEATTERSTRFRWSDVGTIETYQDDNFLDIAALGGQEIQGFGILYDNLYMFLTESIYQISLVGGDEIFKVTKVVDGVGCIAKNSIQSVILLNRQQGLIFLDKAKRVYFFDGRTAEHISIFIDDTMDDLVENRLPYAVSSVDGTDYYLGVSFSGSAENNLILDFQYEVGEWSKFDQIDANAMARVYDVNNEKQTYVGQYASHVVKIDDDNLTNDIDGVTGIVSGVSTVAVDTASSLQVVYDSTYINTATELTSGIFTTSGLIGGILKITGGTGAGEERRIVWNTNSGIVVETPFSASPDATSAYSIGAIDGYFVSKWYDCGMPARIKNFGELYWWADAEGSGDIDVTYATDFSSDIETQSVSLTGGASDAIWGSSLWGVAYWGGTDAIFRQTKFQNSGRYIKFKFQNDDIDETFQIYSSNLIFWTGRIN